jgi:predicted chitinase
MLISPPFLLPRQANETDEAFVARCMPDSSVVVPGTGAPEGSYPVSFKLGWHGGLHLQAPTGADNSVVASVRAIADGEVVYARQPTARNSNPSPAEPRNYNPYGSDPRWTDDGCVVIRHRTEIGANRQTNAATQVTFLSIYMHLSELRGVARQVAAGTATNRNVYRKDVIGLAGHVYGNHHQLHLEIVCDDDNLQRLIHRPTGELNTAQDGRDDSVFGEVYFRLPQGTPFYAQRPPYNVAGGPRAGAQAGTLQEAELYVGLRYSGGEIRAPGHGRGDAYLASYRADGTLLGDAVREQDAEYNLYATATDISNAHPAHARPAPSAVYELLRFGRVIGPDALNPADVPHWRQVVLPGNTRGWVNLNAQGVHRFSDADFPQWRGWRLIDDDADADSRCESAQLAALIEEPGASDGRLTRAELESRLGRPEVRARLKRTICKFPTEWDRASAPARWGWLNGDPEFGLDAESFNELMAHINAVTFDWAAAGTGMGTTHWHWQPREFIGAWRGCGWLSLDETVRCLPTGHGVLSFAEMQGRLTQGVASRNQVLPANLYQALNKTRGKYMIVGARRSAHFFGQICVETDRLQTVCEYASGNAYDMSVDAAKAAELGNTQPGDGPRFKGRGAIQLTGRSNYRGYGTYRGRNYTTEPNNLLLQNDAYTAADASGYYWIAEQTRDRRLNPPGSRRRYRWVLDGLMNINTRADAQTFNSLQQAAQVDADVLNVTLQVNRAALHVNERQTFFKAAYFTLSDETSAAAGITNLRA